MTEEFTVIGIVVIMVSIFATLYLRNKDED